MRYREYILLQRKGAIGAVMRIKEFLRLSGAFTCKLGGASNGQAYGRASAHEAGFSLVEVLVAMSIFMVGVAGVATLAGSAIKSTSSSKELSQAINIAQDKLEALQSVPFASIQNTDTLTARTELRRTCTGPTGTTSKPVYTCAASSNITLSNKVFTWGYTVSLLKIAALAGAPNPNVTNSILKRIDVNVTYVDSLTMTSKTVTLTSDFVRD